MKSYAIREGLAGLRADVALKNLEPALSRQEVKALFAEGRVMLGDRQAGKGEKVELGQSLSFDFIKPWVSSSKVEIQVVHEDADLIVINKPAGMPSHPLERGEGDTALDAVVALYPEVALASESAREGGLVHRLDNDTSGLLMFARNPETHAKLREELTSNQLEKTYLALVHGQVEEDFEIDVPIAHHAKNKKKMVAIVKQGARHRGEPKTALTQAKVLSIGPHTSLLEVAIQGGRRHQIRVHMAAAGHPLVGDKLYGGPTAQHLQGHALHAQSITLSTGTALRAVAPKAFLAEARAYGMPHQLGQAASS